MFTLTNMYVKMFFMAYVVRPHRGVSADDRRAERRARLLEAGLDVLGTDGVAGFTMRAVRIRAGLTERYFYESFANRDSLLVEVFNKVVSEVLEIAVTALADAPRDLFQASRAVAAASLNHMMEDPRRARVYLEAIGHEALQPARKAAVRTFAAYLAHTIADLYKLDSARYATRLEVVTLVLFGGVFDVMQYWLDGSLKLTRDEFAVQVAHMVVGAAEHLSRSEAEGVSA